LRLTRLRPFRRCDRLRFLFSGRARRLRLAACRRRGERRFRFAASFALRRRLRTGAFAIDRRRRLTTRFFDVARRALLRRLRFGFVESRRRREERRFRFAESFAFFRRLRTGAFATDRRRRLTTRFTVRRAPARRLRFTVRLRFATCFRTRLFVVRRALTRLRLFVVLVFAFLRVLRMAAPCDPALLVSPLASRGRRLRRIGRLDDVRFGVALPPARRAAARRRDIAAKRSRAASCFAVGRLFLRMGVSLAERMWPENARDSAEVRRRARARRAFRLSPDIALFAERA